MNYSKPMNPLFLVQLLITLALFPTTKSATHTPTAATPPLTPYTPSYDAEQKILFLRKKIDDTKTKILHQNIVVSYLQDQIRQEILAQHIRAQHNQTILMAITQRYVGRSAHSTAAAPVRTPELGGGSADAAALRSPERP